MKGESLSPVSELDPSVADGGGDDMALMVVSPMASDQTVNCEVWRDIYSDQETMKPIASDGQEIMDGHYDVRWGCVWTG